MSGKKCFYDKYRAVYIVLAIFLGNISPGPITPPFRFEQHYHVDHHGQLTLKQLKLSVLNEMHTNSYSGPRLMHCGGILQDEEIMQP